MGPVIALIVVVFFLVLIIGSVGYVSFLHIRNAYKNHIVSKKRKKFKVVK